jgi:hypothetical protein
LLKCNGGFKWHNGEIRDEKTCDTSTEGWGEMMEKR